MFLLSQPLWPADIQPTHDTQAEKKTPQSSPRNNRAAIKTFEHSYELFMPTDFYQEARPELTLDVLKKFLKLGPCIDKARAPISLFRIAVPQHNHMYIFYSPTLRNEDQLKNDFIISLAEKKHFPGKLETKIFVYIVTSHEKETEFIFWISHFLKSELETASLATKSQLKEMQSAYIKNLMIKYHFLSPDEPKTSDHAQGVRFDKTIVDCMDTDDGQETPRANWYDLSPKHASRHLSDVSKARAFFRKKRPSQTSTENASSATAQITPPNSPTAPRVHEINNAYCTQQTMHPPSINLTAHDLTYLFEQGLCLRFSQEGNSTIITVEKIKNSQAENNLFSSSTKVDARAKNQGHYTINQYPGSVSQAKSSPEVIAIEENEIALGRSQIKKRSHSTPPNRHVNQDSPKSPRS